MDNQDDRELPKKEKDNRHEPTSIVKVLKGFLWAVKPIRWSHHPQCEIFSDHTVNIRNRRFCTGCFIGIPSWILALTLGYALGLFVTLSSRTLFYSGIALMSAYILSVFHIWDHLKRKAWRMIQKIIMGIGAAFITAWIFMLTYSIGTRIVIFLLLSQVILGGINVLRYQRMKKTCLVCEWKKDWDQCPGFSELIERLYSKGLHSKPHKNPDLDNKELCKAND